MQVNLKFNEKIKKMAEYQRDLQKEKEKNISLKIVEAVAEVNYLVDRFLVIDPCIKRIVLFGSLARKDVSSIDFDIDIGVLCSKEKYLAIVAEALDSSFKVDVVDLEHIDNRIKSAIDRDGVILYAN